MPFIIAVEGSIGAGKSTLLPELARVLGFEYLLEPVDTDGEFKRLLGHFMDNPKCVHARNEFQMYITNQRADMLANIDPDGKYLIERSLLSDLVFTHACMANYEDTPEDAAHHMDCYKHLIARLQDYPKIDVCLYLKTDPVVAYNRVLKRGRAEEAFMPMSYMRDLSAYHDAVLPQVCRKAGTRLITMDWNQFIAAEIVAAEMCAQGLRV
ncbi:MAG: deoxynucleoside kinase [Aeromonas popoffii]|uniref:deoxynucleoside kinase n=1 Tax=Aeromonas popoffii TaxID=70856 RepID=UPI003F3977A8